ncbi:Eukaryotic translation initiation factor 3 subunit M [Hondaea fermentalgiana]|uniref:Eukaryotic translation initiation factor 3 subunit M n=1 Tax=Hondaea fermentalgiana TaxID=2315210 RepID=A0A2R5GG69_9STRA|nr:Eukaryotic translation initiation factor 3 subunit M [Hondaea fermentalgiana]|eukprot:GBG29870.1 Eukaryotic translation initiation factor 3 subunit M [Hondaea fermentalgiana]
MATSKASSVHLESVMVELVPLEHIAAELVEHISADLQEGSREGFSSKCDTYIKDGALKELVITFLETISTVGAQAKVADQRSRFVILFSLARHLPVDVLAEVSPVIVNAVMQLPQKPEDMAADQHMRMTVLRDLYTVIDPQSPSRYGMLTSMIKYAETTEQFQILDGSSAGDVAELCKVWNSGVAGATVTPVMQRDLLRSFCDLIVTKRTKQPPADEDSMRTAELKELRFLFKLLEQLEDASVPSDERAKSAKYAARAAEISIKYPLPHDVAQANTLDDIAPETLSRAATALLAVSETERLDSASVIATTSLTALFGSVKDLEGNPEYATLYKLLHVFAAEDLEAFAQFKSSNPGFIEGLGLSEDTCLHNMHLLTLASLAAKNESVTYDQIATDLKISRDDVEEWVIDAITSKLIDAKMDQLNQSIVINRGSQRLLSDDQWVDAQQKLHQWTSDVRELLNTVRSVRQEQEMLAQQPPQ